MMLALAALALASLFHDGVVLQEGQAIPVWGTAAPHAKVVISLAGEQTSAFADGRGCWIGYLAPLPPQAAPAELTVREADPPHATAVARGVAVGEVWLAAGPFDAAVANSFAQHLQRRVDAPVALVDSSSGPIDRVLPDAVRGVIWFGPSLPGASEIAAWRARLGAGTLPLYWAGAAPVNSPALHLPNTGQAVTVDDPDKAEVGRRLALIAKACAYGIPGDYSGPVFESAQVEGSALRLHFRFGDNGLIAAARPLQAFEVAGADHRFFPAVAIIAGSTVVVRSPHVPHPAAVRYAWRGSPEPNLFNGAGLPAAPFAWP